jgi:hypothetical protein
MVTASEVFQHAHTSVDLVDLIEGELDDMLRGAT